MNITLKFISDPGHGWLEVPMRHIRTLGIESRVSGYSFYNDDHAYLEEDCDAGVFMDAARGKNWNVDFNEVHQEVTPIRDYARYYVGAGI